MISLMPLLSKWVPPACISFQIHACTSIQSREWIDTLLSVVCVDLRDLLIFRRTSLTAPGKTTRGQPMDFRLPVAGFQTTPKNRLRGGRTRALGENRGRIANVCGTCAFRDPSRCCDAQMIAYPKVTYHPTRALSQTQNQPLGKLG